jgi:hypothetical protein
MTTKNDSNYFAENPQYHMYLHPEFPSYEEQMAARDRMLENHPDLVFIGCHLASLEWSVDEMAVSSTAFPMLQWIWLPEWGSCFTKPRKIVKKCVISLSTTRTACCTAPISLIGAEQGSLSKPMHQTWLADWEYLVTDNKMTSNLIDGVSVD